MSACLVTGGAGFIGSHLVNRLLEAGHSVRVLDNLSTGTRDHLSSVSAQIEWLEGDASDPHTAARAVCDIEVVFHLAALPSVPLSVKNPLLTHQHCATATVSLLEAARHAGVKRLVLASSCGVYGERPELPKQEDQLPQTLSPYTAAKLASEQYCQAFAACYELETVCLRYFNVYGPRQDPTSPYSAVIPLFIEAFRQGRQPTIFGDGRQSRDFVYVEDVVQANLKAAFADGISGEIFNVGAGQATTLLELADRISELLGRESHPVFEPPRTGDVRHSWADLSKIRRRLGYEPQYSLAEGLRRTVNVFL